MNAINQTALEIAVTEGYGHVDDYNDLHLYDGAVYDRHDRFPAIAVNGDIEAAARAAVELYNAVRHLGRKAAW